MDAQRLAYPLAPDSLIWEVGGFKGEYAKAAYDTFHCRIDIFEPIRSFAEEITVMFPLNCPDIRVMNYGLGGESRNEKISVRNDSSSIYRESTEGKYETISICEVGIAMDALRVKRVDLLSCNCEGCEYELLEKIIADDLTSRFKFILVQFHDFAPDAIERRDKIREGLKKTHTEQWCQPFVWESWQLK